MSRLRLLSAIALLAVSACAAPPPSGSGIAPRSAATSAASGAGAVCTGDVTVANTGLGVDQLFFKPAGATSWGENRLKAKRQNLIRDFSLPFTVTPPGVYDVRARTRDNLRYLQASNIDICTQRTITITASGIIAN